jgi:hypothetical protein
MNWTRHLLRDIAFPLTPALSLGERENISRVNIPNNHLTSG